MMKHFLVVLLVLIFILSIGQVNAQTQTSATARAAGDEPANQQSVQLSTIKNFFGLSMYGGLSMPTGSLAATSGSNAGCAKVGYAIGLDGEVRFMDNASWMTSVDLSVNDFQTDNTLHNYGVSMLATPWTSVWALTGAKVSVHASENMELFCFGQGGLMYGSSPEITFIEPAVRLIYESASATTIGYGFGGGMVYRNLLVNVRYLGGEPEYNRTITNGHMTATSTFKQPTSCFLITAGFAF